MTFDPDLRPLADEVADAADSVNTAHWDGAEITRENWARLGFALDNWWKATGRTGS